jgi:hypothetical protein
LSISSRRRPISCCTTRCQSCSLCSETVAWQALMLCDTPVESALKANCCWVDTTTSRTVPAPASDIRHFRPPGKQEHRTAAGSVHNDAASLLWLTIPAVLQRGLSCCCCGVVFHGSNQAMVPWTHAQASACPHWTSTPTAAAFPPALPSVARCSKRWTWCTQCQPAMSIVW